MKMLQVHPFLVTTMVLLAISISQVVDATITVTATGERFSSYPDMTLSSLDAWKVDTEYVARLQYVHVSNPCSNMTITSKIIVPRDGLPVAVLMADDPTCQKDVLQWKEEILSQFQPLGIVHYIILYDPPLRGTLQSSLGTLTLEANDSDSKILGSIINLDMLDDVLDRDFNVLRVTWKTGTGK
jgi:hypothetical protein